MALVSKFPNNGLLTTLTKGKDIPVDPVCGDPFVEGSRAGEEPLTKKYLKVRIGKDC